MISDRQREIITHIGFAVAIAWILVFLFTGWPLR
jgi:hypothetical protein